MSRTPMVLDTAASDSGGAGKSGVWGGEQEKLANIIRRKCEHCIG